MTPPGLEYYDEAEEVAETAVASLGTDLDEAQDEVLQGIINALAVLALTAGGLIQQTPENLRTLLQKVFPEIDRILTNSPTIRKAFARYFKAFTKTSGLIESYFTTQELNIGNYKALTEVLTKRTADALLQNGVRGEFRKGILDIITTHITSGAPMAKLRTTLGDTLTDKSLSKYTQQVANDAIYQYSRQYTDAITKDLELEHYFYKGTKIESTRGFCASKVGKAFTKAEVEAWASQEWSGKIAGTNRDTIKTNLGGYNCRHLLVPVTKSVYERLK